MERFSRRRGAGAFARKLPLRVTERGGLPRALRSALGQGRRALRQRREAFPWPAEAETPIGLLGRGSRLGGHPPTTTLWNGAGGQGQESRCQLNTSLYLYINTTTCGNLLSIPLWTDNNPRARRHVRLLAVSTEGKIWLLLRQPTPRDGALRSRSE